MGNELPKGWKTIALEYCCDILDNQRIPINADDRAKRIGSIPYYGATGQVGFINDFLFDEDLVLLGEDGAPFFDKTKKVAYGISGKSWVNNHAHVLRAKAGVTSNKFLEYFLCSFDYTDFVNGTTRLKLTQGSLRKIPVRLPPIAEQRRIVAKLDAIMENVGRSKARIEKIPAILKRFRQSVLVTAIRGRLTEDWRDKNQIQFNYDDLIPFESIISKGPQNGIYKPQSAYGEGALILRIDNFYNGQINNWNSLKRLSVDKKEIDLYGLENDDIIINRVNSMSFLGKSAIVKFLPEACVFESNMMRIKVNTEKAFPEYIVIYLTSLVGLEELRRNAKHAVNQASINQQDVKSVLIPKPSIEEQKEIVRLVKGLYAIADNLDAHYQRAKLYLDKLPQSILAKAFRGELVPQNDNDELAIAPLERITQEPKILNKEKKGGKKQELSLATEGNVRRGNSRK